MAKRRGYSSTAMTILTGATYRQIDYWARTHLFEPELTQEGSGSGAWRRYSESQVLPGAVLACLFGLGLNRDVAAVALGRMTALSAGETTLTVDLTAVSAQVDANRMRHLHGLIDGFSPDVKDAIYAAGFPLMEKS